MGLVLKNDTGKLVKWNSTVWQIDDRKAVSNYIPYESLGLTLVSEVPIKGDVDPVLYHNDALVLNADSEGEHQIEVVKIKYHPVYTITVIPDQETPKDVYMKFGGSSTYIKIPAGQVYTCSTNGLLWKYAPYVSLYSPEGTSVYILAEVM